MSFVSYCPHCGSGDPGDDYCASCGEPIAVGGPCPMRCGGITEDEARLLRRERDDARAVVERLREERDAWRAWAQALMSSAAAPSTGSQKP